MKINRRDAIKMAGLMHTYIHKRCCKNNDTNP